MVLGNTGRQNQPHSKNEAQAKSLGITERIGLSSPRRYAAFWATASKIGAALLTSLTLKITIGEFVFGLSPVFHWNNGHC
jgi:hypothetical protein